MNFDALNFDTLFAILLCLTLSLILGNIWFFIFKIKPQEDFVYDTFIKVLSGLFTIIIFYANYITTFNTVLNGLVILFILYLFRNRKREKTKNSLKTHFNKNILKSLALALGFGALFFFLQGYFFYNTPFNNLAYGDMKFYAMVIDFLTLNGVESFTPAASLLMEGNNTPIPYHYSEFWLSALISKTINILPAESYIVAAHSVLAAILVLGMLALSRKISNSLLLQIFAIFSIFVTGIVTIGFSKYLIAYQSPNGSNAKFIVISVFFVWSSILLLSNNKFFYFPLLALPIINIACAPAVLSALAIFALIYILPKKRNFFNPKHILTDSIIAGAIVFLFYILNTGSNAGLSFNVHNIIVYGFLINKNAPLRIITQSVSFLISLYLLYFVPIIPVFFIKQKNNFNLKQIKLHAVFFLLFFGVGLTIWVVTHAMHDSGQFFVLPVYRFLGIFIFIVWAKVFQFLRESKSKYFYLFNVFIICFLLHSVIILNKTTFYRFNNSNALFSKEYLPALKQIFDKMPKDEAKLIAYICNKDNLKNYGDVRPIRMGKNYLELITSNYYVANLNCFTVPLGNFGAISRFRLMSQMRNTPFYQFVKAKGFNDIDDNQIPELQYDFVKEKNIKILILNKESDLPMLFKNEVDTIIRDSKKRGGTFVFLK